MKHNNWLESGNWHENDGNWLLNCKFASSNYFKLSQPLHEKHEKMDILQVFQLTTRKSVVEEITGSEIELESSPNWLT